MSGNKAALKAAKSALDAGRYEEAVTQAQVVLASDASNYFAKLFLGRAFEKQGKLEDAAKAYHSATELKPDDGQAWLGLCSLYESQGSQRVDEYGNAAVKVAEIYAAADDKHRCQSVIDKLVSFAKQHGTSEQYKRSLAVQLPGSPVFDFLEGRIPHPSHTFTRLAEITEDEERQRISKEIIERRTRIGAKLGQVTIDVKREVLTNSSLEGLYQEVINWTSDDEVRRQYEEKLLQRAHDTLLVLSLEHKDLKRDQVLGLAQGMVIIKHPFQLAWNVVLEWKDVDDLQALDAGVLHEYVVFFPDTGLGGILKAYLSSELSPFPSPPGAVDTDDEKEEPMSPEDRLLLMTESLESDRNSPLGHRLVSNYYLHLEEHQTAAETARAGLHAISVLSQTTGLNLQSVKDALNSTLATSLVYHQTPRNHPEAKTLFEDILQRKPRHTPALIGLGIILEETEEYADAIDFLSRALEEDPNNVRIGTETAWCRALGGDHKQALDELEHYLPLMKADDPRARDLRSQVLWRIGICMWELDSSKSARKDRNGAYSRFLAAIKTNVNFAPAYNSLGIYYADYGKDKKRARQCFQKAFELSSAELEAAERLARSFADQGDWDIVEVISQRVVDSGRARPPPGSKKKGVSWPFSALGVVQMNKQEYTKAIVSFLAALRISPDDYQSYVGLGESYHNSGRYNSASRTFMYAEDPQDGVSMRVSGETWFARYMLANVHRELGEHDEAINGLQKVLSERPKEFGVLLALLQTYVERASRCVELGLFGQAVDSANLAIDVAIRIVAERPEAFNLWKAVGDACMIFSWVQSGTCDLPVDSLATLLKPGAEIDAYELLSDIDNVRVEALTSRQDAAEETRLAARSTQLFLTAGILAYKRAIHACSHDVHAQAVAWYNLGWAEYSAYSCTEPKLGKKYLRTAVRCFKRAIELEAGNADFWNALGVVTTTLNPKVAQHSFVRSLHLNEMNARAWTNLGVLYMLQNDHELAHQSFARAQSIDPGFAHAWLGEGLIALLIGETKEALNHFTHAFAIADSASLITKRQYALSTFDHLISSPAASNDLTALVEPLFALQQLQTQVPSDLPYRHLAALFMERVDSYDAAIEALKILCTSAEAEYEASESLAALARFANAKTDLGRCELAASYFEAAAESAETSLDLLSDAENSGLDAEARRKLRLSAHLTAGLAYFNLGKMDGSIAMFRTALEESHSDPDVVCLLVRVLWAKGGTDEKAAAREQLFECVSNHQDHTGAVVLLGAIAALDGDNDTMAAVQDDLSTLRTTDGLGTNQKVQIEELLAALVALDTNADDQALAAVQSNVVLDPSQPRAWSELAEGSDAAYPAQMALKNAKRHVPPSGTLKAEDLAQAFAGVGTIGDAQRAIFLAPSQQSGWEALTEALGA